MMAQTQEIAIILHACWVLVEYIAFFFGFRIYCWGSRLMGLGSARARLLTVICAILIREHRVFLQ